jgi:hypothetical protein
MLIASWGATLQGWVICYAWSLFFYGVGLGGEVRGILVALFPNSPVGDCLLSKHCSEQLFHEIIFNSYWTS